MYAVRSSKARWLWGAVIASIVVMQWLAFVHRIAHNHALTITHALPHTQSDAAVGHGNSAESHHDHSIDGHPLQLDAPSVWWDGLFTHQEGDVTCSLHDALAAMDGASAVKNSVYFPPPTILLVAFSQIMSTARAAALFEARGPPAIS